MKLKFKHQKFQADAAKAVVDVFKGQPKLETNYLIDSGDDRQGTAFDDPYFTGWKNQPIVPQLNDKVILENLNKIQRDNFLAPSPKLEGHYNLTIEMETGVGKTYTYIKTMYELNKYYGWSKFIVVVPSIAIREGVYKSFAVTQEHFAEEYKKKIRFFIYNSNVSSEIKSFLNSKDIYVMIINSQAFNSAKDYKRKILDEQESFNWCKPIDLIAKTNPILIIDEPQSVEGKQTKESLKRFNPLMTLRYSATHKADSIYNMVYRLDAMDAYNKKLVKKITVKGIKEIGTSSNNGFVYLQSINLSASNPTATIQFNYKGETKIRKVTRKVSEDFNVYDNSNGLEEYKNGFTVVHIDGRDDSIEFLNGIKLYVGEIIGQVSEEYRRRIQIRETILSHIELERKLFYQGIKVLSLFFIDEVANYRKYKNSEIIKGDYAKWFEEEYNGIINNFQPEFGEEEYLKYLNAIKAEDTHAGYFSIDKKGKMIDSKVGRGKGETSDDVDAYDLIMKNKELLLDINPQKSPVRFIFSHSALREGWDNPNVFQICTLKHSDSEVRKRQEVGRGLRLCVNQNGERMDGEILGNAVHDINILTVVASESYQAFTEGLQREIAENISDKPRSVNEELFKNKEIKKNDGTIVFIDDKLARVIYHELIRNGYVDDDNNLTQLYYHDKDNNRINFSEKIIGYCESIIDILDTVYNEKIIQPENARKNNVELHVQKDKLAMPEFKALWQKINARSVYVVDFDTHELIAKAVHALNTKLHIAKIYFKVETGELKTIESKEMLLSGDAFVKEQAATYGNDKQIAVNSSVKYDLIGKLVEATGLTRKDIVAILIGIEKAVFNQFKNNPEEFIIKAAALINDEKATAVIQHITYNMLDEKYDTNIFTEPTLKGNLGTNVVKTKKHLYDHVLYDSATEKAFAQELDTNNDVAVYVKLPNGFYISTPVGKYNPDWAIAFYEGSVKHIYFVAETKGSMSSLQLKEIEKAKIHCAKEHFKVISNGNVVYNVVNGYDELMNILRK